MSEATCHRFQVPDAPSSRARALLHGPLARPSTDLGPRPNVLFVCSSSLSGACHHLSPALTTSRIADWSTTTTYSLRLSCLAHAWLDLGCIERRGALFPSYY